VGAGSSVAEAAQDEGAETSNIEGLMVEERTPNSTELANMLSLATERQDIRAQWLGRLLRRLHSYHPPPPVSHHFEELS
jgi:hypothetical protein